MGTPPSGVEVGWVGGAAGREERERRRERKGKRERGGGGSPLEGGGGGGGGGSGGAGAGVSAGEGWGGCRGLGLGGGRLGLGPVVGVGCQRPLLAAGRSPATEKTLGLAQFDAVILGKNGLEIDYPVLNSALFNESDIDDGESDGEPNQTYERKRRSLSTAEIARALSRTKDFTSRHLHCKALPTEFWKENLCDKESNDCSLCISHDRTWPVKLNLRAVGTKGRRVLFQRKGWKEFTTDNNLEIGDVCIFELVNKIEMLCQVTVNRDGEGVRTDDYLKSHEEEPEPRVSLSVGERDKALSSIKDFTSPYPHCKVVRQRGNLSNCYDLGSIDQRNTIAYFTSHLVSADQSEVHQDQPKTKRIFKRPTTSYKDETTCIMQSIIDHIAEEGSKCQRLGENDVEAGKDLEYESFDLETISKNKY
ncbi:hypothetical protein TIFTF001_036038 [Ficus carica]|uniref:TF-B3 domain-containing protein n=1 Tax=Ficus carica TaxID=3494 RepID=A0AA88E2P3_FICCA|nr:hypothetical protein TIFTF001_036038 [Ficus carica]